MRAVLIDWISLIVKTLNLRKETLFLTCYIIDYYLSQKNIERKKL